MRKFDLSLRSSRSSYFATFRHQLTILSNTDALDEEKCLNMLCTFVKDWFRFVFFFFNDTATTEIYTLSLHDALPTWHTGPDRRPVRPPQREGSDPLPDRKSTRLNSSHANISYAAFCLHKNKKTT